MFILLVKKDPSYFYIQYLPKDLGQTDLSKQCGPRSELQETVSTEGVHCVPFI